MPIYEYRCQSCGHELEKLQRINDAALTECPVCGKDELRRLISAAGFRLKGGGWYETDFKQGNKRNLADSGDGAKAGGGEGAKTEAGTSSGAKASESSTGEATSTKSKADSKGGAAGAA